MSDEIDASGLEKELEEFREEMKTFPRERQPSWYLHLSRRKSRSALARLMEVLPYIRGVAKAVECDPSVADLVENERRRNRVRLVGGGGGAPWETWQLTRAKMITKKHAEKFPPTRRYGSSGA